MNVFEYVRTPPNSETCCRVPRLFRRIARHAISLCKYSASPRLHPNSCPGPRLRPRKTWESIIEENIHGKIYGNKTHVIKEKSCKEKNGGRMTSESQDCPCHGVTGKDVCACAYDVITECLQSDLFTDIAGWCLTLSENWHYPRYLLTLALPLVPTGTPFSADWHWYSLRPSGT